VALETAVSRFTTAFKAAAQTVESEVTSSLLVSPVPLFR
jgi:hypothetical protein